MSELSLQQADMVVPPKNVIRVKNAIIDVLLCQQLTLQEWRELAHKSAECRGG